MLRLWTRNPLTPITPAGLDLKSKKQLEEKNQILGSTCEMWEEYKDKIEGVIIRPIIRTSEIFKLLQWIFFFRISFFFLIPCF